MVTSGTDRVPPDEGEEELGNTAFYLLQFAVFVAIALCVGIGLGYLIWGGSLVDATGDLQPADESEAVADLRAQVEARDTEITRLRKRLKRAHADLEARGSAPEGEIAALAETHRSEVVALTHQVTALHQELDAAHRELESLRANEGRDWAPSGEVGDQDVAALLEELDAARAERRRLESDILSLRASLDEQLDQASVLGAAVEDADRTAVALQRAEAEVVSLRREVDDLRVALDQAGTGASGGAVGDEVTWARLQAELERSRASAAAWRDRLTAAEDEAERLAGELAEATARLHRAANAAEQGESRAADLQESLLATERALQSAREELRAAQQAPVIDRAELDALEQELAATRAQSDRQVQSLHLELSDARLRADEAHQALAELSAEFVAFRDTVLRQQSTVSSIAARLDRARGVLGGRMPDPAPPTAGVPVDPDEPDDLMALPGATEALVRDLRELEVATFEEIGSWDAQQLERFEDAVGDTDGVMRANGWVLAARRLWEERTGASWSERSAGR